MVFVGDRRTEQRHDPVAGELVDEPFEAPHAFGEDLEEALHDRRELLGVELLGQLHRSFDVGEENGDLLALAFDRTARGQDLFRKMLRRVGPWLTDARRLGAGADRPPAGVAELGRRSQSRPAAGAAAFAERGSARFTELRALAICVVAAGTLHRSVGE